MLYPFGYKIKTKYQQYTSMGIIYLYFLEVQYFKRISQETIKKYIENQG